MDLLCCLEELNMFDVSHFLLDHLHILSCLDKLNHDISGFYKACHHGWLNIVQWICKDYYFTQNQLFNGWWLAKVGLENNIHTPEIKGLLYQTITSNHKEIMSYLDPHIKDFSRSVTVCDLCYKEHSLTISLRQARYNSGEFRIIATCNMCGNIKLL